MLDTPVSYTHLDVYKRQVLGSDAGSKPLLQKESGWEKSLDAVIAGENTLVDCLYR